MKALSKRALKRIARAPAPETSPPIAAIPHSWDLTTWPPNVFPGSADRAVWTLKSNRSELARLGALTRVGRNLVVIGAPYLRWLESRTDAVAAFGHNNPNLGREARVIAAPTA